MVKNLVVSSMHPLCVRLANNRALKQYKKKGTQICAVGFAEQFQKDTVYCVGGKSPINPQAQDKNWEHLPQAYHLSQGFFGGKLRASRAFGFKPSSYRKFFWRKMREPRALCLSIFAQVLNWPCCAFSWRESYLTIHLANNCHIIIVTIYLSQYNESIRYRKLQDAQKLKH